MKELDLGTGNIGTEIRTGYHVGKDCIGCKQKGGIRVEAE